MTMQDMYGCEIEIGGPDPDAALTAWNAMNHAFLAHGASTPVHLGTLLELDPDNVLGLVCKGLFTSLLGRRELVANVGECVEIASKAHRKRGGSARRETDYLTALTLVHQGHWTRAAIVLDAIADYEPEDAMAFKLAHALRFMLGDRFGMRASSLRAVERFSRDNAATGYVYGCHAFALEETGDYKAAERFGKEGVMMAPDDAWGIHAVAHVYDMTAQAETGIRWLEARPDQWAHCNNFSFHFFWHLALHYLEVGDYDKVLALYDEDIRKEHTDDYRDISNGTSLLVRLEGMGVDVGNRWEELVELCDKRSGDNCVVFADLHYMHALGRANKTAAMDKLIETMRTNGDVGVRDMDDVNRLAGVAAAEGIKAYYHGEFSDAFEKLASARPNIQQIGGSHAQRDVFERMTIDAGLKAGRYSEAKALIEDRTWRRSVEDSYARDRMHAALTGRSDDAMVGWAAHRSSVVA
ncbi:MAG: tetratricopeptide repeat protein [Pseudomonadota bacterium]